MNETHRQQFEDHLERRVREYRGSPQIADMLAYHFGYGEHGPARRGKRLRPMLLMRVALAEGGTVEGALDAAASIEILHNYSLIHDDIEDQDELRHGRKTMWSVYGVAQALNAGDACCALSSLALLGSAEHHRGERVVLMLRALHESHAIMCDGQALDLSFEAAAHVDLSAYLVMIGAKTAALFGAAAELGALCAPCSEEEAAAYRALGRAYGLAFQIRDDVLGVWASVDQTGKVTGNDIARRKWTFPVVWALSQPPSPDRDVVASAYSAGGTLAPPQVDAVIAALDRMGAREAAEAAVAEHLAVVERHPTGSVRDFLLQSVGSLT